MRKQNKFILWPVYFDSTKTRLQGRRVPKNLAVPSPSLTEIREASDRIGLNCEVKANATHPSTSWIQTGLLLVSKNESKTKTLRKIGKTLTDIRKDK